MVRANRVVGWVRTLMGLPTMAAWAVTTDIFPSCAPTDPRPRYPKAASSVE